MRCWTVCVLAGAWIWSTAAPPPVNGAVTPLVNAHAHNDYLHPQPLTDALDQGFCSVEADIYLVEGKLLVAHEPAQLRPEREKLRATEPHPHSSAPGISGKRGEGSCRSKPLPARRSGQRKSKGPGTEPFW